MRVLLVFVSAIAFVACGIPDTGCPASQPTAGSSCTSLESCPYTTDGGTTTCRCAIAMGSTDGMWQCAR